MVGGVNGRCGINKRLRFREKNEKGERKAEENYIKNREKGLKNASFCPGFVRAAGGQGVQLVGKIGRHNK